MKVRTKMEKIGLEKISSEAKSKLTISIEEKLIPHDLALKLKGFFGTKSIQSIIEQSITHTASSLIVSGDDLLEYLKIDKLGLVKSIKNNNNDFLPSSLGGKIIKFKAMTWQLIIIASCTEDEIKKVEDLVVFCLNMSLKSKKSLLGDD